MSNTGDKFVAARNAAAREYSKIPEEEMTVAGIRSLNDCYIEKHDDFESGANWARTEILTSPEMKAVLAALDDVDSGFKCDIDEDCYSETNELICIYCLCRKALTDFKKKLGVE